METPEKPVGANFMHFGKAIVTAAALLLGVMAPAASAYQSAVDQADPSIVEQDLREDPRTQSQSSQPNVSLARPEAGMTGISGEIIVGAVHVDGATMLPPAAFAAVAAKYAGLTLSPQDLKALATDVANVARSAGFGLATAWVPEQRVTNGVLRVVLDEGRIDAVEVSGNGAELVRRHLAPLAGDRPVRIAELERHLLLADDVTGIRMGKPKLVRRGGRNILTVSAVRDRVQVWAGIDNWGSSTVGPVRARLVADLSGLLAEDDRLTIGGTVTPLQPAEFRMARLAYSKMLGSSGGEVTIGGYIAHSEPGGILGGRDIKARSGELEATLRYPFLRTRAASLWGSLEFRVRDSEQTRADLIVRDDRLATVTASAFAVSRGKQGRARARLSLIQGLDLFGATGEDDPLASRLDATGRFSKVEFWGEYEQGFGHGLSVLAQAEGQVANGPLLSSEEMGLGGRYFGRAWDYREFSGDKGIAGSLELRMDVDRLPRPATGAQLYVFLDGGSVGNYEGGYGGGSLASAGGGARIWLSRTIEADFGIGFPLTEGFNPTEGRKPRFSFSIGSRF
jgi:hemolysin activation/secretion protein